MTQVKVETVIRRGERFVSLAEATGRLTEPEARSIDGAILLTIDGRSLLTTEHWDDVDALWAYLLNGLTRAALGKPFRGSFPDQPLAIRMEPLPGERVRLGFGEPGRADHRDQVADLRALSAAMVEAGQAFYDWLASASVENARGPREAIAFLRGGGPAPKTWSLDADAATGA